MDEQRMRLRDFGRAIKTFRAHIESLFRCDSNSWNGEMVRFRQFVKTNKQLGSQILEIAASAPDNLKELLFREDGQVTFYEPPEDQKLWLSCVIRYSLEATAGDIVGLGYEIYSTNYQIAFDKFRNDILLPAWVEFENQLLHRQEDPETPSVYVRGNSAVGDGTPFGNRLKLVTWNRIDCWLSAPQKAVAAGRIRNQVYSAGWFVRPIP